MSQMQIDRLLDTVIKLNAADLHLAVGRKPTLRVSGGLKSLDTSVLNGDDTTALMKQITPERCQQEIQEEGHCDFGFAFGKKARFRVAIFRQKGHLSLVLRQIPNELLTFEQIGLPLITQQLLRRPRGLFLVTGPTGSGKTTSLATMIDWINMNLERHIITIEDPIEYYHEHKKCIVNQREMKTDVYTFAEGLKRALRQDPDCILIGEMRDLETIETAIEAAETGHIVFGTLHTSGAASTINRVIDAFPTNQQEQIRVQLSTSLMAVLSQSLLKRDDKPGRVAAYEFLVVTPAIANLIREGKTFRIDSAIQTGRKYGMQLLDDHLWDLYQKGVISQQDMIDKSKDPAKVQERLQRGGRPVVIKKDTE